MNRQQKWEKFQSHMDKARHALVEAEYHSDKGNFGAAITYQREHWYELLLAAEANYSPPRTEKQQRQQKLWQQRGLLERTLANLKAVRDDRSIKPGYVWEAAALADTISYLYVLIRYNKEEMSSL